MAVSKEELIETLSNMSILEVTDLVSELEEKWGVLQRQRLLRLLRLLRLVKERLKRLRTNLML